LVKLTRQVAITLAKGISAGKALIDYSVSDGVLRDLSCAERMAEAGLRKARTDAVFVRYVRAARREPLCCVSGSALKGRRELFLVIGPCLVVPHQLDMSAPGPAEPSALSVD
jgi:hypothetical protein